MSWWTPTSLWRIFEAIRHYTPIFAGAVPLQLPWVVLGELYYGAQRAQRRQEQLAFILDLLTYAVVLVPDQDTAAIYGEVKSRTRPAWQAHSG